MCICTLLKIFSAPNFQPYLAPDSIYYPPSPLRLKVQEIWAWKGRLVLANKYIYQDRRVVAVEDFWLVGHF